MSTGSWCSCCSVNYSDPESTSSNNSGRSIASIQDYILFSKPTSSQIESTSGYFSYQNLLNCSHQPSTLRNEYNNAYDNSSYIPYIDPSRWASYIVPKTCFSPPQYYESYIPYKMSYPTNGRSLGTSECIPTIPNHSHYESLAYQAASLTCKQLNSNECSPLVNKTKLETTQDNSTKISIPSCNRPTRRKNDRKPGSIKYQCPFCFKIFSRQYNLKSHIKIHTKERPHSCQYGDCTWTFARPHDLKRHQLLHLGIKPFECVCGKRFSRSDAYKRHLKSNIDCSTRTTYMSFSSSPY